MTILARRLGLFQATGFSISIIAPTAAMALNVSLTAQAAGRAAPLAFAIGTVVMAIVGLSFVAFSRRIAHAGSAYAYVSHTFGRRWGFIAGWTLLLTYLAYAGGVSALVGSFLQAAVQNCSLHLEPLWLVFGVGAIVLATYCAYRDMRIAARLMLALEGLSVLAILVLSGVIVAKIAPAIGLPAAPFIPSAEFGGWSGVGYGLVFTVLSFAGFEGATTLGEEVMNPRRSIPIAIVGTVILAGAFFVFVSYAQVIGYGLDQIEMLGNASAPLNDLAIKYVSKDFATAIDLAAAVSAFACIIGSLSAAARLLFALGRVGLAPRIGEVDAARGTPGAAVVLSGGLCLIGILVWAPFVGAADYFGYLATIGTLALILVYGGVTGAELVQSLDSRRLIWALFGLAGMLVLLWPLYNSVYPIPDFPRNLWPYVVITWIFAGVLLPIVRPALVLADDGPIGLDQRHRNDNPSRHFSHDFTLFRVRMPSRGARSARPLSSLRTPTTGM
jgi:amino acid transporter